MAVCIPLKTPSIIRCLTIDCCTLRSVWKFQVAIGETFDTDHVEVFDGSIVRIIQGEPGRRVMVVNTSNLDVPYSSLNADIAYSSLG